MTSHIRRTVALVTFITGVILGMASLSLANATNYSYTVWSQPGTQSTTATLTCGWHAECTSGSDGPALDWLNWTDNDVYCRSYSSNSQGISFVGRVYVANWNSGSCHTTFAELKSPLGSSLQGIVYLHTDPSVPGSAPYVWSGYFPQTTSFVLGATVDNDCDEYPDHLHQEVGHTNWVKNSYYPTRASCDNDSGCQSDNVWGEHHSVRSWSSTGY